MLRFCGLRTTPHAPPVHPVPVCAEVALVEILNPAIARGLVNPGVYLETTRNAVELF